MLLGSTVRPWSVTGRRHNITKSLAVARAFQAPPSRKQRWAGTGSHDNGCRLSAVGCGSSRCANDLGQAKCQSGRLAVDPPRWARPSILKGLICLVRWLRGTLERLPSDDRLAMLASSVKGLFPIIPGARCILAATESAPWVKLHTPGIYIGKRCLPFFLFAPLSSATAIVGIEVQRPQSGTFFGLTVISSLF